MKTLAWLYFFLLILSYFSQALDKNQNLSFHSKEATTGAICIGPDLSKIASLDDGLDNFIQIDQFKKVNFHQAFEKIAFENLDLGKSHRVKLLKGKKVIHSFKINFMEMKTNFILVWKAAGAWKAIPISGETCKWPLPASSTGINK